MTLEQLKGYVDMGNEIEFAHEGRKYSITYFYPDNGDDEEVMISFCEFYKETTEVRTVDELWNEVSRYGRTVGEMLSSIRTDEIRIF